MKEEAQNAMGQLEVGTGGALSPVLDCQDPVKTDFFSEHVSPTRVRQEWRAGGLRSRMPKVVCLLLSFLQRGMPEQEQVITAFLRPTWVTWCWG